VENIPHDRDLGPAEFTDLLTEYWGAPLIGCRTTTMSMSMASRLRTVSRSVSPFDTLDPLELKLTTSADSRFSASSNEIRVRVEASKNRLTTVRFRSAGTFFTGRSSTSLNARAESRMLRIVSRSRPSKPRRC
jgi:hypothetical protein